MSGLCQHAWIAMFSGEKRIDMEFRSPCEQQHLYTLRIRGVCPARVATCVTDEKTKRGWQTGRDRYSVFQRRSTVWQVNHMGGKYLCSATSPILSNGSSWIIDDPPCKSIHERTRQRAGTKGYHHSFNDRCFVCEVGNTWRSCSRVGMLAGAREAARHSLEEEHVR